MKRWKRALERHLRVAEKLAWLDENPDESDWQEYFEKTLETLGKTVALRAELAEWVGAPDEPVIGLLCEYEEQQAAAWTSTG